MSLPELGCRCRGRGWCRGRGRDGRVEQFGQAGVGVVRRDLVLASLSSQIEAKNVGEQLGVAGVDREVGQLFLGTGPLVPVLSVAPHLVLGGVGHVGQQLRDLVWADTFSNEHCV